MISYTIICSTTEYLNNAQYGFRQNCSCETALLRFLNCYIRSSKQFCYVIDFSRAFGKVNWDLLIHTWRQFTNDTTSSWFQSYLFGRRQTFKYCNVLPDFTSLFSRFPQGSTLGPSFFALYINDVLNMLSPGSVVAYVDDLTLIFAKDTPVDAALSAENTINLVVKWITNHAGSFLMLRNVKLWSPHPLQGNHSASFEDSKTLRNSLQSEYGINYQLC